MLHYIRFVYCDDRETLLWKISTVGFWLAQVRCQHYPSLLARFAKHFPFQGIDIIEQTLRNLEKTSESHLELHQKKQSRLHGFQTHHLADLFWGTISHHETRTAMKPNLKWI